MAAIWGAPLADILMDTVALYLALLKHFTSAVALLVSLSCLDDLLMDGLFALRWVSGRLKALAGKAAPEPTAQAMACKPADWIALFVPARDEANVIGAMLRNTLETLDYPRYRIFVGTYPDDPATQKAVRAVADTDDRVLCIVGDHSKNHSSKAANLNVLYRTLCDLEARGHPPFKAVVLHDAEDVVHPLELRVFNWHVPRTALVQLPVLPLPHEGADWRERWWAHTYLEEFAIAHTRDMVVRNWLGASLPSAGVGCAFSRPALTASARLNDGLPFRTTSKTEDYELGISLGLQGFSALMARVPVSRHDRACVATRSLFPRQFDAAVRQRSRWILGITLGGWRRFGWPGRLVDRYMLLRDRKALPCAWLNLLTLVLAVQLALLHPATLMFTGPAFPPLVEPGSVTAHLLAFNLAMLLWRGAQRVLITARFFGFREGLESLPRSIAAIFIHAAAAAMAQGDDRREKITGEPAPWRKTVHSYPTSSHLS